MTTKSDKITGKPGEEASMPFYSVIVQLRINSMVKEHQEPHKEQSIAKARKALFKDLGSTEYRVNRVYDTIPFVALEVSDSALEALKKSAFVEEILEDTVSSTQKH